MGRPCPGGAAVSLHATPEEEAALSMRAACTSILLLAVLASPASAQFKLAGGINLANFFGDAVEDTESRTGLNLGASVGIARLGPVRVLAEGYYRQKGAQSVQALEQGGSVEWGIDYIEIPVLARVDLPLVGGRLLPYLQGGPAFAWKIDCGIELSESGTEQDCDDLLGENLDETLRDYEQGLVLGGGLDLGVLGGAGAVNLDARYTRGLTRISEGSDGLDIKNQALSVMLGYSFGFNPGFRR